MHEILTSLHTDHINLSKLLTLLKRQSDAFLNGGEYDLFMMIDIADYIQHYSDKVHHPKEDIIYKVYLERYGDAADIAEALLDDHETLPSASIEFRGLLDSVINLDTAISREKVSAKINEFIDLQMEHMNTEEGHFFPLVDQALNTEDWDGLAKNLPDAEDPLFSKQVIEEFKRLSNQIDD